MKIPRSQAIVLAIGVAAAGALSLAACTYDWNVGPAALATEAGALDAAVDAPLADATAPGDAEAGPVPPDSASDAPAEAAEPPTCSTLTSELNDARIAATMCQGIGSGQCSKFVTDECHCESYVAILDAGYTTAYVAAIAAFLDGGCSTSLLCDAGCTLTVGSCVSNPNLSGGFICE